MKYFRPISGRAGTAIGAVCVFLYHSYSIENTPSTYYILSAAIVLFCYACSIFGHYSIIGSIGVLSAIFLMGSPLSTLQQVIVDKSTRSMPSFSTSLTTWFNAFSWSLYGIILAHDYNVYVPNLLGLLLATVQILLYAMYGAEDSSKDELDDSQRQVMCSAVQ